MQPLAKMRLVFSILFSLGILSFFIGVGGINQTFDRETHLRQTHLSQARDDLRSIQTKMQDETAVAEARNNAIDGDSYYVAQLNRAMDEQSNDLRNDAIMNQHIDTSSMLDEADQLSSSRTNFFIPARNVGLFLIILGLSGLVLAWVIQKPRPLGV